MKIIAIIAWVFTGVILLVTWIHPLLVVLGFAMLMCFIWVGWQKWFTK